MEVVQFWIVGNADQNVIAQSNDSQVMILALLVLLKLLAVKLANLVLSLACHVRTPMGSPPQRNALRAQILPRTATLVKMIQEP